MLFGVCAATAACGCFSERSYPMQTTDIRLIRPLAPNPTRNGTVREWLATAAEDLSPLLPQSSAKPLLTEDLVRADGKPVDVFQHFGVDPNAIGSLFGNYHGILYTARLVATRERIDSPAPPWPDFEDAWIPVDPSVSLAGRIGYSRRDGVVRDAPCIIILPGFFGDNGVQRSRDLAAALLDQGYHVLAVEMRGHGQTEAKYPNVAYQFGARESADLLTVAEWAQAKPHVVSTGLIGYCWSGHTVLMAAWADGRCEIDPAVSPLIAPTLPKRTGDRHFTAGVISFSPSVKWEEILDWLDVEHAPLKQPIYAGLQDTVRSRMARKGTPEPGGSLRRLISAEFQRTELSSPQALEDVYTMLRFMPYKDKHAGQKLHRVRVPVLIVHAADDPMIPAQWTADFAAITDNPNVASLILPSGGHVGFAAWARAYYFSLIVNFFDMHRGAAAAMAPRLQIRDCDIPMPTARIVQ